MCNDLFINRILSAPDAASATSGPEQRYSVPNLAACATSNLTTEANRLLLAAVLTILVSLAVLVVYSLCYQATNPRSRAKSSPIHVWDGTPAP